MTLDVQTTETDGKFYVDVIVDGHALERRRGPFSDAVEAEATAARVAAFCRALTKPHLMGGAR